MKLLRPTNRPKARNPRERLLSTAAASDCNLLCVRLLNSSRRSVAMSSSEVACTLAALILHDDGIPITAEKIATLVKAANIKVEAYWPALFAKLLEGRSVDDLILSVGSGGGAAPEEAKEESDDDMGFSLFD
uniref:60S acidic ribosomal protein P1 n=1 Tax=Leersia perrieri TaxID=77586 RepID=A0A0D9X3U7_9ORYZ